MHSIPADKLHLLMSSKLMNAGHTSGCRSMSCQRSRRCLSGSCKPARREAAKGRVAKLANWAPTTWKWAASKQAAHVCHATLSAMHLAHVSLPRAGQIRRAAPTGLLVIGECCSWALMFKRLTPGGWTAILAGTSMTV